MKKGFKDVAREFSKLKQLSNIKDNQERFEELKSVMLVENTYLTEHYFVSNFISGLQDEIKSMVMVLKPNNLLITYEQVKLHELTLVAIVRKSRMGFK